MRERYKEGSLRTAKNILSVIEEMKDKNELVLVFLHRSVDGDCVGSASGIVSSECDAFAMKALGYCYFKGYGA